MTDIVYQEWQHWCNCLQKASDAFDRNRNGPHRREYICAYRYAIRRCESAERRMP